nr:hypothetical protein [Pandoravirus belohorizontensis]
MPRTFARAMGAVGFNSPTTKANVNPVVLSSCCPFLTHPVFSSGLFTPWADVEGRPLWTLLGEAKKPLATTPLIAAIDRTVQQEDGAGCYARGCAQHVQFKCERCERLMCLKHHVKYRSGYRSYDFCPACASRTRRVVLIILAIGAVGLTALCVWIYFHTR